MKECLVCRKPNSEVHHIVFRSQQKALKHCKYNYMYLCGEHHRGDKSPHKNRNIDLKYKLHLQNKLEKMFLKREYTEEEVKEILGISIQATRRLLKTVMIQKGKYTREAILRSCMGGKLY